MRNNRYNFVKKSGKAQQDKKKQNFGIPVALLYNSFILFFMYVVYDSSSGLLLCLT